MTNPSDAYMNPALAADDQIVFTVAGEPDSDEMRWFADGLRAALERQGHIYRPGAVITRADSMADQELPVRLVLNLCAINAPRPIKRRGQGTFVATVFMGQDDVPDLMKAAYPLIVKSLSNMIIYNARKDGAMESHFITPEQGHYVVRHTGDEQLYFEQIYERVQPLACSHLVINNEFVPDLPEALWGGDIPTQQIGAAGRTLDSMGLLPAAIPIQEYLNERELRHVKLLYGIGGLSYGNLSARALHNPEHFWMSASGVDKSKLETVGRDILLVTGYDQEKLQIALSVPANVEPRRVSVDAIEHFMIYREHPSVGAIVHIHAWWNEPIPSTMVNYPCGSYELAYEVAELVRQAPDPSRAVIGLKNHGLTITGHSIAEIFQRIDGHILNQVPMD